LSVFKNDAVAAVVAVAADVALDAEVANEAVVANEADVAVAANEAEVAKLDVPVIIPANDPENDPVAMTVSAETPLSASIALVTCSACIVPPSLMPVLFISAIIFYPSFCILPSSLFFHSAILGDHHNRNLHLEAEQCVLPIHLILLPM
jgi:hypothetical protein